VGKTFWDLYTAQGCLSPSFPLKDIVSCSSLHVFIASFSETHLRRDKRTFYRGDEKCTCASTCAEIEGDFPEGKKSELRGGECNNLGVYCCSILRRWYAHFIEGVQAGSTIRERIIAI